MEEEKQKLEKEVEETITEILEKGEDPEKKLDELLSKLNEENEADEEE
jgi:sulfite reductase alpha subunit-like flavoprotein